jgi:hypothetical protein
MNGLKELQFEELSKLATEISGSYEPVNLKRKPKKKLLEQQAQCKLLQKGIPSGHKRALAHDAVQVAHKHHVKRMQKSGNSPYWTDSLQAKLKYTHPIGPRWPVGNKLTVKKPT